MSFIIIMSSTFIKHVASLVAAEVKNKNLQRIFHGDILLQLKKETYIPVKPYQWRI